MQSNLFLAMVLLSGIVLFLLSVNVACSIKKYAPATPTVLLVYFCITLTPGLMGLFWVVYDNYLRGF